MMSWHQVTSQHDVMTSCDVKLTSGDVNERLETYQTWLLGLGCFHDTWCASVYRIFISRILVNQMYSCILNMENSTYSLPPSWPMMNMKTPFTYILDFSTFHNIIDTLINCHESKDFSVTTTASSFHNFPIFRSWQNTAIFWVYKNMSGYALVVDLTMGRYWWKLQQILTWKTMCS